MINTDILEKYKKQQNAKLGNAIHNGVVIGYEVDNNNKIFYIIEREGKLVIEDYKTARPTITFSPKSTSVKI